jgi:hypothetical protein
MASLIKPMNKQSQNQNLELYTMSLEETLTGTHLL